MIRMLRLCSTSQSGALAQPRHCKPKVHSHWSSECTDGVSFSDACDAMSNHSVARLVRPAASSPLGLGKGEELDLSPRQVGRKLPRPSRPGNVVELERTASSAHSFMQEAVVFTICVAKCLPSASGA